MGISNGLNSYKTDIDNHKNNNLRNNLYTTTNYNYDHFDTQSNIAPMITAESKIFNLDFELDEFNIISGSPLQTPKSIKEEMFISKNNPLEKGYYNTEKIIKKTVNKTSVNVPTVNSNIKTK